MNPLPPGDLPKRPVPGLPLDPVEVSPDRGRNQSSLVWVIGPVVAGVVLFVIFVLYMVIAARR